MAAFSLLLTFSILCVPSHPSKLLLLLTFLCLIIVLVICSILSLLEEFCQYSDQDLNSLLSSRCITLFVHSMGWVSGQKSQWEDKRESKDNENAVFTDYVKYI